MKMPLISVIVPVYKVELYLERCVSSIINQTYKNLEIILVDDGSPDNCGEICDEFKLQDNRIVVIHQKNMGLSAARNVGISKSTGDYITFVDSDDYIENDTYEKVADAINKFDSDLVFFREKSVDESGKTIYINGDTPSGEIFEISKDEAAQLIIGRQINGMCDKVYKASVLNGLLFKVGHMYGEDFIYNLYALSRVEKISYVDQIKYSYVMNNSSVTHKSFNKNSFDQVYFKDAIASYVEEHFPKFTAVCQKRAFLARLRVCRPIYFEKLEKQYVAEINELNEYMLKNFSNIKNQLSTAEMIEYRLYMNFKPLYKIFVKVVKKLRK